MENPDKVAKDFIKAFNLGYEIAKELNLMSPMFKNQNISGTIENPMQAGMIQYIKDNAQNLGVTVKKSSNNKILETDSKNKVMIRNRGKGLIL